MGVSDDDNILFDDADSTFVATTVGAALEEFNDSINAGIPNGAGAKVHWSQILGMPAAFADGTDDGAGATSLTSAATSGADNRLMVSVADSRAMEGVPVTIDPLNGNTAGMGTLSFGTNGAVISAASGVITLQGAGLGFDENLVIDLDTQTNEVDIGSTSGVIHVNLNFTTLTRNGSNLVAAADINTATEFAGLMTEFTGSDAFVRANSPTLVNPALGTIGSGVGTALTALNDDNVSFDDADNLWTATAIGPALEELNDSINAGVPNGAGAKTHWSQLLGVPAGFADGTDDGAGGATTINDLGDATADGSVAQGAHEMDFTSTIDAAGESIWTITNITADAANDVSFLDLKHNDADDANVIYMRMIGDADGTPETDFEFAQDGAIFTKDLTVPTEAYDATGWNGDLTVPTKDAVRDKIESISLAFDIDALTGTTAAALDSDDVIVISVDGTELKLPMSELELWIESLTLDLGTVNFTTLNTDVFNIFDNVDQSHSLSIVANENLAANINLNLDLDGATRSLNIQGDVVLPAGTALVSGGALGTPSSGTVTNLTGTASININGTVGATTPTTGAFTSVNVSGLTASQAVVTDGSKNLASVAYTGSGNVMRTRTGVVRNIWVDAGAMISSTTRPALVGTEELGTNDIMVDYFAFDDTTDEAVQFKLSMPDEWDLGTVKVKVYWYSASATTSHTAVWGVKARAVSNDDALDGTWGSEVEVSDDVIAAGDLHVTAATGAITVGGTPALGDIVMFEIDQDATEADHSGDVKLTGVMIQYTESATEPAAW